MGNGGGFWRSPAFSAWSEYPVTKQFASRAVSPILFFSTILIFAGLCVFNILTQGKETLSHAILLPKFVNDSNGDTTCQPAAITVGNSFFTTIPPSSTSSSITPGGFQWAVGSVATDAADADRGTQTGFQYTGDTLTCNISSVAFNYRLQVQSYVYGICSTCSTSSPDPKNPKSYIELCSNFDLSTANLPAFTHDTQQTLEDRIFGVGQYYSRLNFPANAFSTGAVYPPYTAGTSPNGNATNSRDVVQLASWFNCSDYVPASNPSSASSPDPSGIKGTLHIGGSSDSSTLSDAYLQTSAANQSGLQLAIIGIGGLQPLLQEGAPASLPTPLPEVYDYVTNTLALMMDTAATDVNGRAIATDYLCTVTSKQWKTPWALIAVVLGNTAGVLGGAFTAMMFLAKQYDQRRHPSHARQTTDDSMPLDSVEWKQSLLRPPGTPEPEPPAVSDAEHGPHRRAPYTCAASSSVSSGGPLLSGTGNGGGSPAPAHSPYVDFGSPEPRLPAPGSGFGPQHHRRESSLGIPGQGYRMSEARLSSASMSSAAEAMPYYPGAPPQARGSSHGRSGSWGDPFDRET